MNKRNLALAGIVAVAIAGAGLPALAQTTTTTPAAKPAKTQAEKRAAKNSREAKFKAADTNGDGGLSRDELSKAPADDFGAIRKNFDQMDANKDGKVTMDEQRAWAKARRAARKAKKQ
jgi:Ca2+-binding EF-hand superfamily protein